MRPIVAIGTGAIVRHAHWPAYRHAGFEVLGAYDSDLGRARALASEFGVSRVYETLEEALAQDALFDVSVPASALAPIISRLPKGSHALIQKPFGENLAQAQNLAKIAKERQLSLSVNFQLRTAPYMIEAQRLIQQGEIGEVLEIDFKVNVNTPWADWPFLENVPRMEIVYHSIHYLDFIRSLLGEPETVQAQTIRHPASPELHSSRSAILLGYHPMLRATVFTNHGHRFGPDHQESSCRIEGTEGCLWIQMGLNMNYPHGAEDRLEAFTKSRQEWHAVRFTGSWFPEAFIGPMTAAQRWTEDPNALPPTHLDDALKTMQLVERCYEGVA